ncbi:MAG TPA: GGDEF domain-containing protein [Alphaproteobacteria bacterium]|nr:GGDEF domain-containing protein [Alphaproteobacteria bacterium]
MDDLSIPANPNNFAVWYHYSAKTIPDLTKALDALLNAGETFTNERSASIFSRFFTLDRESEAIFRTAKEVEKRLVDVIAHMKQAGDGAAAYGEALLNFTGEIQGANGDKGDEGIKDLISGILETTRDMGEKNKRLEKRLQVSSLEISRLKENLEEVRFEAMTDALTGIPNRKLFDIQLRREATEADENDGELSLLMIDIDYFKKFNDTYGHLVGDQVLRLIGAVLTSCVKGRDTAARYGGEEFAIILPDTDLGGALAVGEGICAQVGEKKVLNKKTGEDFGQLTISIGVGVFKNGEPPTELIARADKALYRAKKQGRNRVVAEAHAA